MSSVKTEQPAKYEVFNDEDKIIEKALAILRRRMFSRESIEITRVEQSRRYVELKLSGNEHEVFAVIMLDSKHRVIDYHEMFRGTVNSASVYPREVLKQALADNASAVIFAHNHPSGGTTPSDADKQITSKLEEALGLVDIKVLDHLIVGDGTTSMAEMGMMG
jgi:DNA repair protein RadC